MTQITPGIIVNGVSITPDDINMEVQYHPSENLPKAKYNAMKALVIKELLLQRAKELDIIPQDRSVDNIDETIEKLLEQEIKIDIPDKETCLHYYEKNRKRFYTSPLFHAFHILYIASPGDEKACEEAKGKAISAINMIKNNQVSFEEIARKESACSSSKQGGDLGQITLGSTLQGFETALLTMNEGEISTNPVKTEVGYHIIKVVRKINGEPLPFEIVEDWIRDYIKTQSWNTAFNQYIKILAGQSNISGFKLEAADSPLVQ